MYWSDRFFVNKLNNAELSVDLRSIFARFWVSKVVQSEMVGFTGSVKLKVIGATDLKPAILAQRRLGGLKSIDPYVSLNVDDVHIARTSSKQKTSTPVWNEEFEQEIENGYKLGITVFHDAIMGTDPFVADSWVPFEEIMNSGVKGFSDIWVRTKQRNYLSFCFVKWLN